MRLGAVTTRIAALLAALTKDVKPAADEIELAHVPGQ
jgi:hypothetical protein